MTSLSLFAVLALLPVVSASGSTYDPAWSSIQPKRVFKVVAKADAKDTANGERLRKAIESLVPGDQLEVGAGTYSVDRLWDLAISGTSEAPIWIVAAKDAKVIIIERNLCYRSLDSVMQVQGEAIVCNNVLIDGKNAAFASTDHQGNFSFGQDAIVPFRAGCQVAFQLVDGSEIDRPTK